MPGNYPPLARLSENVEDRRGDSLPDMLSSFALSQMTPEKIRMMLAHPMMGPIARANLINAQQASGVVTPLGSALGLDDMRLR